MREIFFMKQHDLMIFGTVLVIVLALAAVLLARGEISFAPRGVFARCTGENSTATCPPSQYCDFTRGYCALKCTDGGKCSTGQSCDLSSGKCVRTSPRPAGSGNSSGNHSG